MKGPQRPGKRDELERLSGQRKYPVIEFEDGRTTGADSKDYGLAHIYRGDGLFDEGARRET